MGASVSQVVTNNAGKIFLAPQPLEAPQMWLNIGYDSYDGYQIPEYIEQFEEICTKEQYDDLMKDIREHFEKHSLQPCCARYIICSIFCPVLLCCTIPYSERRRREFDAGFDQIIRKHQRHWKSDSTRDMNESSSRLSSPASNLSPKVSPSMRRDSINRSGLLRWTYGFPLPISPNKAYDSQGNELIASVETKGNRRNEAAWPPPYYNIVLTIPQGYHYRIRNKWPGEAKPANSNEDLTQPVKTPESQAKSKRLSPKGRQGSNSFKTPSPANKEKSERSSVSTSPRAPVPTLDPVPAPQSAAKVSEYSAVSRISPRDQTL